MRDYKIVNSDLGYRICRRNREKTILEYFDVRKEWNPNRTYSKIFFHREDAVSALVIIKRNGGEIKKSEPEKKSEKQSRSEF